MIYDKIIFSQRKYNCIKKDKQYIMETSDENNRTILINVTSKSNFFILFTMNL